MSEVRVKTRWGPVLVKKSDPSYLRKHPDALVTAVCRVPSEEAPDGQYEVLRYRKAARLPWSCTCPDFRFRLRRCKHIARATHALPKIRSTK